jgi:hypothetical protein
MGFGRIRLLRQVDKRDVIIIIEVGRIDLFRGLMGVYSSAVGEQASLFQMS